MSEVMRHAVEDGQQVKDQIILKQDDFLVDSVGHLLSSPPPPPPPLCLCLCLSLLLTCMGALVLLFVV